MTVLSPSQAPRWKTTTSTLPRRAVAAYTVRSSTRGAAPKETSARPDDFRKKRRELMASSPLEFGGAQDQAGNPGGVGARGLARQRLPGGGREAGGQQPGGQRLSGGR